MQSACARSAPGAEAGPQTPTEEAPQAEDRAVRGRRERPGGGCRPLRTVASGLHTAAELGNLKCHRVPLLRMGVHGARSQLGLLLESTCVSGRPSDGSLTRGVGIICVRRDENKPLHLPPKSIPT